MTEAEIPRRRRARLRQLRLDTRPWHASRDFSRQELLGTYLVDMAAMFFAMPVALYPFVADELNAPGSRSCCSASPGTYGLPWHV